MLDAKPAEGGDEQSQQEEQGQEQQQADQGASQMEEAYAVPVPPPDAPTGNGEAHGEQASHEPAVTLEAAKEKVFHNGGYPLLIFIASLVLMIAASQRCSSSDYCSGKFGWAVAGGVLSLVASLMFLMLEKQNNLTPKFKLGFVVGLTLCWVFIAGFCTFGSDAPFPVPSNGYFAAWGGLLCCLVLLSNEVGRVRATLDRFAKVGPRFGLILVGSIVVMFAGVAQCDGGCSGKAGYAIATGVISFGVALARVLLAAKIGPGPGKWITAFLILFWAIGAFVLTFFGPFTYAGNGYFATWGCLIASIMLLNP